VRTRANVLSRGALEREWRDNVTGRLQDIGLRGKDISMRWYRRLGQGVPAAVVSVQGRWTAQVSTGQTTGR